MSAGNLRERIVDTALELAASEGWEQVRLYQVAAHLNIGLTDIQAQFAEKEDIVDAVLERADQAMLAHAQSLEFHDRPVRERLHVLIMVWLDALGPWRRVVREMVRGKLEPGHLHVQLPALLRISRTVQWLREAAGLDATYLRRSLEESVLTSIFVAAFLGWLRDDSAGSRRTRRRLDMALAGAERGARLLRRLTPRPPPTASTVRQPAPAEC